MLLLWLFSKCVFSAVALWRLMKNENIRISTVAIFRYS